LRTDSEFFRSTGIGIALEARRRIQETNGSISQRQEFLLSNRRGDMLGWALTFLIVALIAAVFGFGGIASGAANIAQILFFVFLVLFVVSLLMGRRSPTV
jgi:uncharacterized membrane protein YtjA (UPF0391 family)